MTDAFASVAEHNHRLDLLVLRGNQLDDQCVELIEVVMSLSNSPHALDVSRNRFSSRATAVLRAKFGDRVKV
jgi:hypothetical protein